MHSVPVASGKPAPDIRQIALCEAKGIEVPKNARILDYGCGAGRRVYQLSMRAISRDGYDVFDYLKLRDPSDRQLFHIDPSGQFRFLTRAWILFSATSLRACL